MKYEISTDVFNVSYVFNILCLLYRYAPMQYLNYSCVRQLTYMQYWTRKGHLLLYDLDIVATFMSKIRLGTDCSDYSFS